MRFKAGDKVWLQGDNARWNVIGIYPAVVLGSSKFQELSAKTRAHTCGGVCTMYDVEIVGKSHPTGKTWVNIECMMWPRDEDGRQVGTWEHGETTWRPEREHA